MDNQINSEESSLPGENIEIKDKGPMPLMDIQFENNLHQVEGRVDQSSKRPNSLLSVYQTSLVSEVVGSSANSAFQYGLDRATDNANVSMCHSKSFEDARVLDSSLFNTVQGNNQLGVQEEAFKFDRLRFHEIAPFWQQFEEKMDGQLNSCIDRLNNDVQDLIEFAVENISQPLDKNSVEDEDDIKTRLSSLKLLEGAIYTELCGAENVSNAGDNRFDSKKRERARKISKHM